MLRSLEQRAGGDLGLAGGRCRSRSSRLGRAEKIPQLRPGVVSSSVCLFAHRSRGGELEPRRTTEKRTTVVPRTNPGYPRRGWSAGHWCSSNWAVGALPREGILSETPK